MKGTIKVEITDDRTKRSVIHHDDLNPTNIEIFQKHIINWIENNDKSLLNYIRDAYKLFNNKTVPGEQILFRGVTCEVYINEHLSHIGPTPTPEDNRYTAKGEHGLYLISNHDFLFDKIKTNCFYYQKYCINLSKYHVADLCIQNFNLDNTLKLAFFMAERGRTNSGYDIERELCKRGKSKYYYSQLLASYFKKENYNGLLIPGVYGISKKSYNNLVLFGDWNLEWRTWISGMPIKCFR